MLYGILLIFIFSCSWSRFLYPSTTKLGATIAAPQRNCSEQKSNLEESISSALPYPLHTAVYHNEPNWVNLILAQDKLAYKHEPDKSTMQVNRRDPQGYLPIHWAVDKKFSYTTGDKARNNIKILNELLQYSKLEEGDNNGKTVLHWAVINNNLEAVEAILEYCKKNFKEERLSFFINQKDNDTFPALHYTVDVDETEKCTQVQLKILNTLLNYSAVNIKERDKNGMTVLHWAVANNNLEAVKEILKHAKSTLAPEAYKQFVQIKTYINPKTHVGGCSAIYWTMDPACAEEDAQDDARAKGLEIFNLLLPECEMNDQDNQGYTVAHWAAVQGRSDLLKVLISHQADLSLQDTKGRTVLHATLRAIIDARIRRNLALIDYLMPKYNTILNQLLSLPRYSIGFDKKDADGNTATMLIEIIQRLKKKEANKVANGNQASTAYSLPPKKRKLA